MFSLLRISCRTAARRVVVQAPRRYLSEGTAGRGGGGGGGGAGAGGGDEEKGGVGETRQRLEGLVKKDKVVVFIKGTPAQPMCGFSNAVVQILRMHGVENYGSYNVLEDQEIRQGIKNYSNWPTIPQIYFDGEFVGGCDILLQMHQNGDLVEELKKLGIRSALLDTEKEDKK
ncbi:glutaredoxin-related protein 5, mitochondrial [Carcharodon carcharias]|uniref:glutaredoxin-related protein 5, mitochondrial n=1 Tax=Carcharodon carcharias TaxID=13397 RepID=UPI001B7DC1C3|nr:glutaredoxin-related protein 5, mitochondrial [Carcharodon carcharias]